MPPHVILMKRLTIADYEPGSDSGNMRFYPKGRLIKSLIEQYVSQKVREYGGVEVETPVMYDFEHPSLSSYLNRFPARQYVVKSEDKDLFLRFSACFGQFLMVKDLQISYRQLPFSIYELTRYSFRREKSGEVSGLRRLRAFTMPDCHALCRDLEQAKKEVLKRFQLSLDVLEGIGLGKDDFEFALRFTKQFYNENRLFLTTLIKQFGKSALAEMWDEKFFYFVFKWEFNFIDNLDKASALSTDQIDVENAERYGITYVDEDDARRYPIILHNSPSGAIERCIYALLEKAHRTKAQGGTPSLPLWLSPSQIRLIPLSPDYNGKAENLADELEPNGLRIDIDDRDETVSKRIRTAEREWIPYIAVIGEKEVSSGVLQIRDRQASQMRTLTPQQLRDEVKSKTKGYPFQPLSLPRSLKKWPQFPG
jgi:threonyl-tRNA synthetase